MIPSNRAYLITDVPWSLGYAHVRLFDSPEEQQAYFFQKVAYICEDLYYIRTQQGHAIKVPYNQYELKDVNYLMFQNSDFGTKWFYAFVTHIDYQANGTTLIYFDQDVWQTWQFQLKLDNCFIERQHTVTDGIGVNTVPEGLEIGPYITTASTTFSGGKMHLFALTSEEIQSSGGYIITTTPTPPGFRGGFPVSAFVYDFGTIQPQVPPDFGFGDFAQLIGAAADAGKSDAIIAVFIAPDDWTPSGITVYSATKTGARRTMANGYVPKNNKLYCYPYCCLAVVADGQSNEFRYEDFSDDPTFVIRSTFGPDPSIYCAPVNYAGYPEDYTHAVTIGGYPLLPWIRDYYQNWLAQKSASLKVSANKAAIDRNYSQTGAAVSGLLGTISNAAAGNAVGAIGSAASAALQWGKSGADYEMTIAAINAKKTEADIIPNSMVGNADAKDVKVISGIQGFHTYCRCIKEEYLKICDDYFSMYGYAIHRIDTPNLWSRRYWNYVKTVNAEAHGDIPLYATEAIEDSLDRGVTFWHIDDVANYSYDNSTGETPVDPDPSPVIPDDPDDPDMPIYGRNYNLCPIQRQFTVTARFGETIIDAEGHTVIHKGTDLACPTGTPIYSVNRGTVVYSGWATTGYGWRVITSCDGYLTLYAHMMQQPSVEVGDTVAQGDVLGYVGQSGNATGPHLHVGVCLDNGAWNWLDPNTYIPIY